MVTGISTHAAVDKVNISLILWTWAFPQEIANFLHLEGVQISIKIQDSGALDIKFPYRVESLYDKLIKALLTNYILSASLIEEKAILV